jgi:hypothetical protein
MSVGRVHFETMGRYGRRTACGANTNRRTTEVSTLKVTCAQCQCTYAFRTALAGLRRGTTEVGGK